jgi:hypothetical protein
VEDDRRNYRKRHFVPALKRVEAEGWREGLADPGDVRESVAGLAKTRPYDLGRHTHSALMLRHLASSAVAFSLRRAPTVPLCLKIVAFFLKTKTCI